MKLFTTSILLPKLLFISYIFAGNKNHISCFTTVPSISKASRNTVKSHNDEKLNLNKFIPTSIGYVREPKLSLLSTTRRSQNQNVNKSGFSGITFELISQLAIVALKLRLEEQSEVDCIISSKNRVSDFIRHGKVGPVTVKGKGWESPLGLTCRAIEATVDECSLDLIKIVQNRKLNLIVPAKGKAMIALNSADFGSFLTHPLLKPPHYKAEESSSTQKIMFYKNGVEIDPKDGSVKFKGKCMRHEFQFILTRGEPGAIANANGKEYNGRVAQIKAFMIEDSSDIEEEKRLEMEAELSNIVSQYFSSLVFELDGTFLSYRDMMVTHKGKSPSVMLALSILVRKFPSPGVAF